jgi:hypothetical protein
MTAEEEELFSSIESDIVHDGGLILTTVDAMHLWMVATSALNMLDAADLKASLAERFEMGREDYVAAHWLAVDTSDEQMLQAWLDRLGDHAKVILQELQAWLDAKSMSNVRLICFLPCHGSFGGLKFNADGSGRAVFTEW